MRRAALIFLCALAVGAVGPAASQPPPRTVLAAAPIARLDLPWWRERFERKTAELRQGPVDLAFYGDSITQDYERGDFTPVWQRFYGRRHAVNLGFTGDTTANLLWRIEHGEADGIAPAVAVVLIGANNFGRLHWSAADTEAGIVADVAALRHHLPRTRILLLGVLPADRGPWVARQTNLVNAGLTARYARDRMVRFLDIGGVFRHAGRLDLTLFLDPASSPPRPALHPNATGQARMAEAIEPVLADLLGKPGSPPQR